MAFSGSGFIDQRPAKRHSPLWVLLFDGLQQFDMQVEHCLATRLDIQGLAQLGADDAGKVLVQLTHGRVVGRVHQALVEHQVALDVVLQVAVVVLATGLQRLVQALQILRGAAQGRQADGLDLKNLPRLLRLLQGALGHGIHDVDTSTLLTIKRGTLYRTSIQKVQKGSKGNPGTMEGIIVYNRFHQLGVIEKNTDAGIYGELNSDRSWIGEEVPIQVAKKEEIKTGEARIRCYIDGEVKEYTICITQIDKESDQVNKGMVIQVTDTELLEKTGGIIQGMSGSPIIQNGNLIGAVTHVFVQDSTKGYGIFI